MFIILEYIAGTYENLNILLDEYGEPKFFSDFESAKKYAKKNCAFHYKIIEI